KPAIGMEAGGAILYRLNKNLQIKTGLQFNVRQYYIDAYWSPYNIATIAYVRNHQLDSVNMLSSYSNAGGFQSAKLDNKLYQISIPIGVQWSFFPDKKIGVDAGISFQPTLTLNKNVYLLS
ncbi:MAG: outer membrane beta-barrel protein, partial [Hydrotalea flava]|nr:outer membrane beta-barrel protein [Hydrotalea flava]NIM37496.1 outer membrane beta-barrel protein [Hydrotalea flava]NIN02668.1 outer membrane beta-barrel protein [Hydrotalea flava]NIN14339.1 outer membrane beta-barrel protein [Hydrotalea flava]NIO93422.1 outer membrane beta-barrel protein [Hydrotalea flava]